MDDRELIKLATVEAIYWRNDSEDFYHRCFKKFDDIKKDVDYFEFFREKILKIILNNYSIRRNIPEGEEGFNEYFSLLWETEFISRVKKGDKNVIDEVSLKIKQQMTNGKESKKGKNTISLLSKLANMINPNAFPMLDSLVKDSLWIRIKEKGEIKKKDLEKYSIFKDEIDNLINTLNDESLFIESYSILNIYEGSLAYKFYSEEENKRAFKYRVVDKLLWLEGVMRNSKKKYKDYEYLYCYKEFFDYIKK